MNENIPNTALARLTQIRTKHSFQTLTIPGKHSSLVSGFFSLSSFISPTKAGPYPKSPMTLCCPIRMMKLPPKNYRLGKSVFKI